MDNYNLIMNILNIAIRKCGAHLYIFKMLQILYGGNTIKISS